jgi:hypothetical protein
MLLNLLNFLSVSNMTQVEQVGFSVSKHGGDFIAMNGTVIVCGRAAKVRHCRCGREAIALCDWKMRSHSSGTCDAPLCALHSKEVERGKHLCPEHQDAWKLWQRQHPPAQASLF